MPHLCILIAETGSLVYLGGLLSGDSRIDSELARRIGFATAEYHQLQKLWGHAHVSIREKVQFVSAFVVSKLVYGLSTACLNKAHRRRLDGFYARGLRRILRIPAAFVSRVSSKAVYQAAGVQPLSEQLVKRQLVLLGQVARAPATDPLRRDVFIGDTLRPVISHYIRRVGRPRVNWTEYVLKVGAERLGGQASFHQQLQNLDEKAWKAKVASL